MDGNGLAVSEAEGVSANVSVAVKESVCVAVDMSGVSVAGGKDVFAGISVSIIRVGIGVDVRVQANNVRTNGIKKNDFRLINKLSFQDTIPE